MTIYGKPEIPISSPTEPFSALYQFPVFQTREDYRQVMGKEPPPPDPSLRRKHWMDPAYSHLTEDNGEEISYLILAVDPITNRPRLNEDGKPYLVTTTIPAYIAGRVNIPHGVANEFPAGSRIMRFSYQPPVRALHKDEELDMTPGPMGTVIVVNRAIQQESVTDYLRQIRELLDKIERRIS